MHRKIVYNGQLPLETDLLGTNLFAMIGLGRLAMDLLGSSTLASGMAVTPTSPASMTLNVGPGAIYQIAYVDTSAYSSIAANTTDQIMKQGILSASDAATLTFTAPTTSGYSIIYLVEAAYADVDTGSALLNYYNSANPAVPYTGPAGNNSAQPTVRAGKVNLQIKAGVAGSSPAAPTADSGFIPLYYVTVPYGATSITSGMIATATGAPFITSLTALASSLPNYATQVSLSALATSIASTYMPISGGVFAGSISGPTPTQFDTSTKLATMAALQRALGNFQTTIDTAATTLALTSAQAGSLVYSYASSAQTITLPSPASVPLGATFTFVAAGAAITINTPSGVFYGSVYTGNGTTTTTLVQKQTLEIASDGINWLGLGSAITGVTPSTGDNSTNLATTAFVYGNTLGHGQTWKDVTSSRAANTTYTNTNGRPIQLRIVCSDTSGASASLVLNGTLSMVLSTSSVSYYAYQVAEIIIPAGTTYSVTSGANIQQWLELS